MADRETYDLGIGDSVGVIAMPKSRKRVSANFGEDADKVDALAHVLADNLRRTIVVVGTDDTQTVVAPSAERMLDS